MTRPTSRSAATRCALLAATAVLAAVGIASTAIAQQPSRAQQAIEYRQAMYTVLGANFGALVPTIQGKAPYDKQEFAKRADRVAYIAEMLSEGFGPESKSGAPTEASPKIWEERAEFDKLLTDMQQKTQALSAAAGKGDLDAIKPAFMAAGQSCKACHDKYRID